MLTPLNYVHRSKPTRVSFSIPAIVLGILTLGVIGGKSVNASSLRAVPLAELTEKTDLWVRGKVLLVESHSLEEDERYKFDFQGSVEIKAVIRVVQSVPETAPNLLTIHWVSGDEISKSIVPDRECIAAVQLRDDGDYKSYSQLGIYGWFQPDSTTKMIRHVQEIGEGISPDLLWELVSALRWGLDKRGGLQPELAEIWRKRLLEGNFHEFAAATLVFQVSPNSAPPPESIVDAFERQYRAIESQLKNPSGRVQLSAEKRNVAAGALTVFLKIGNEACAERLVSLCERTFQDEQKKIFEEEPTETESLVRAILASGGPRRVELLSRLISRNPAHSSDPSKYMGRPTIIRARFSVTHVIGEQKGEDIDKLLIDMLHHPDYYDIQESLDFAAVWEALARRGNPELERYLLSLLQNSQSSDLKVPDYRSVDTYASESLRIYYERLPHAQKIQGFLSLSRLGDVESLYYLLRAVRNSDKHLISNLASIRLPDLSRTTDFCLMAVEMADPAFLPQLRALAETGADYFALKALAACGDAKLAGELAIKNVEQTLVTKEDAPSASISIRTVGSVRREDGTTWRKVYDQINFLAGTVKFMGETGNPEYVTKIEPFTREGRVEELRTALASAAKASGEEPYTFAVDELNRVAILALARAGGATAIARLKEIYDKGDIKQRVASAMALHSLGDETATELIQLFIEHRERENVEIAKRYRIDMTDDFHRAASYLCSERTNAVLIERLKSGFEDNDDNLSEAFLKGHASFLLPILAQNLSHHDETVRYAAFHLLKRILPDVETDYDPNKPARWQVETINRLRQRALDG